MQRAGTLVSVNIGMPKDVQWQGKTVFTGVFKTAVDGPRRVRRLNVDGDGQGDLAGHGGEQRAAFVYQLDSYRYWEHELGRDDFVHGQFGENFTIDGLSDDEVCVGDRYRIGGALFEVTQARVTCYRVGIRMNDPRIPALLVSHHRPGFYFRVLEEGDVEAGDEILKVASGPEQMTVAEVDALLYLPGHPRQQLLRALRIPALSPGWQGSFRALLDSAPGGGNAGLADTGPPPAWPGFRRLTVTAIERETDSVISVRLADPDGAPLPPAVAGQWVTLRIRRNGPEPSVLRNYSLSGAPGADDYRITVKREVDGVASGYLSDRLAVGDQLEIAAPRGTFVLGRTSAPVLLISAGIGATPVLAMLHALVDEHSDRQVWWLHGARDGREHPFAAESRALLASLPNAHAHLLQPSRPGRRPGPRLRRVRAPDGVAARAARAPDRRRGLPVRPLAVHERDQRRARCDRRRGLPHPHRAVRPGAGRDARHRGCADASASSPGRPAGRWADDRVRAQQPRRAVGQRLRQSPRARRSMRRSGPLVVPHRRLSHLRDRARRRQRRVRPGPGGAARRRQRAHLLLAARREPRPRSLTLRGDGAVLVDQ
jgi:MOSC domain-containing protein YiiM/ferredoxin-NADP reductase